MVKALLSKLLLRELKKNWFQYLSMLLITILAVTLFLGFLSNSLTLSKRAEKYFEATNVADLIVQTGGFTGDDRAALEALDTQELEYRVYSDGRFEAEEGDPETAKIYITDGAVNAAYITEGEAGVMIDARVAALRGYAVGDKIAVELSAFSAALAAYGVSGTFSFTVTGLMHSPEIVNIYARSPVYLTPEVFLAALAEAGFPEAALQTVLSSMENQAVIRCADPDGLKTQINSYFTAKETNNLLYIYDHDTMEAVVTIDEEVSQSANMLYVFPVIFFLVALLVILSTVSRLVLRERLNIGTLKALGVNNRTIALFYALPGTAVVFLGCLVGAVLGPCIVPNVMGIKYTLMFSMPFLTGIAVSPLYTLLAVLFVCLCAFLIGMRVSRSVVKENPSECMRPKQTVYQPGVKRGSGSMGAAGTHALLSLRMALRNIRINPARAALTVLGVLGCGALLLTSFGIGDTLDASVANDYGGLFRFDVISGYTSAQEEEFFATLDALAADGTVQAYERVREYAAEADGKAVSVWVLAADSVITDVAQSGNALSKSTAESLGAGVGEVTITLGSETVVFQVEELVRTTVLNGFFTTENPFGAGAYCSETVWVKTDSPEAVRDALDAVNGTDSAMTLADKLGEIGSYISSTNTMKYTLMVFAILLSVVVLYNLSLLNLKERTRDMATLKVLGYTNVQIALSLIFETMLLTVLGTALGCVFGYPLLWLVMKINEISVLGFVVTLRAGSYALAALLSIGTAAVINIFCGLPIRKIDMTTSLKSVE